MQPGKRDNRVRVLRPAAGADEYGDVAGTLAAVGPEEWVSILVDRGRMQDLGPGDEPVAPAKGSARYGAAVRSRDVLRVVAGPETGTAWRVLAVFHPGRRSAEMTLETYTGPLP